MSSNDPLPPPPPGDAPPPPPPFPASPPDAMVPGPLEAQGYQGSVPAPPPNAVMPEWYARGVRLPPALPPPGAPLFPWPHPNFWWSIPWCVGYFLFTQVL